MPKQEAPWGLKSAPGFPVEDRVWLALSQLKGPDREAVESALASEDRLSELSGGGSVAGDKSQFRVAAVTPTFRLVFRPAGRVTRVVDLLHQGVFDAMRVALRHGTHDKEAGTP